MDPSARQFKADYGKKYAGVASQRSYGALHPD